MNKLLRKIYPILFLIIISSFFIFYKFSEIPQGLNHDENEIARAAFSLENKPYTSFTPVADGHATLYLYTLLFSFKTFGVNPFALRLPSKIFGIISIILFYLIMNTVFKLRLKSEILNPKSQINSNSQNVSSLFFPILLSIILLTSRWYLHFVRFSFEMPFLLFLELASLYFLLMSLKKNATCYMLHASLILSGLFAGLAFNSYQPGRIFFLVPLFALIYKKIKLKNIVIFLTTFIMVVLPISVYLITNPGNDIRINQQFFLKNSQLSVEKKAEYLGSNISSTFLMLVSKGDINGTHNYTGKPALNPILFAFFFIGFMLAIKQFNNFNNKLFLLYFFIAVLPTILTYPWENPNMLRTYTALPSIIYFASLAFISWKNYVIKKFNKMKYLQILLLTTSYLLLATSSIYEMRTYFKYQPLVFKQTFDKPDYLKIIRQNALK